MLHLQSATRSAAAFSAPLAAAHPGGRRRQAQGPSGLDPLATRTLPLAFQTQPHRMLAQPPWGPLATKNLQPQAPQACNPGRPERAGGSHGSMASARPPHHLPAGRIGLLLRPSAAVAPMAAARRPIRPPAVPFGRAPTARPSTTPTATYTSHTPHPTLSTQPGAATPRHHRDTTHPTAQFTEPPQATDANLPPAHPGFFHATHPGRIQPRRTPPRKQPHTRRGTASAATNSKRCSKMVRWTERAATLPRKKPEICFNGCRTGRAGRPHPNTSQQSSSTKIHGFETCAFTCGNSGNRCCIHTFNRTPYNTGRQGQP
jgi:hypothetical protein